MGSSVSKPVPRPWIISPLADLLFLVATPLVAIPLVFTLARGVSLVDLSLIIVVFATGHHLPTFLRTYGDRELFRRYWVRLTVIPLGLLTAQAYFLSQGWQCLGLILLVWAPWHSAMQTYGFMRIYDAKQGQTGHTTARLDWLVCIWWFASILLWSPHYLLNLTNEFHGAALPLPSAPILIAVRWVATVITAVITAVYLVHTAWLIAQGQPLSRLKLVLMISSLGTYYFAFDLAPDPVVGLASWEIFHDVQYFAIVWAFNRRLVEKGQSGTRALRFLFRPRLALLGIYLALIGFYGAFDLASGFLPQEGLGQLARSVFVVSGLLHFYYDGFIWRVRQPKTREYLNVAERNPNPRAATPEGSANWPADLRQCAYVLAPVLLLGIVQGRGQRPSEQQTYQKLTEVAPSAGALHTLGRTYQEDATRLSDLARESENQGRQQRAREQRQSAAKQRRQAMRHYREALRLDPKHQAAHYDLGNLLLEEGDVEEAIGHFAECVVERPEPTTLATLIRDRRVAQQAQTRANAYRQYAAALLEAGRVDDAAEQLWNAWNVGQPVAELQQEIARELSDVLFRQGRYGAALEVLHEALALGPAGRLPLRGRLARLLATCPDEQFRNPAQALRLAKYACEQTDYRDLQMLETLAHSYAAVGNVQQARDTTFRLVRLAELQDDHAKAAEYRALREQFESLPSDIH